MDILINSVLLEPSNEISKFKEVAKNPKDIRVGILLANVDGILPLGTPVITYKSESGFLSYVKSFFPNHLKKASIERLYIVENNSKFIMEMSSKGIIQDKHILEINKFNFDKTERIKEFVQENNTLYLVIKDPKDISNFFKEIKEFEKKFEYFTNLRSKSTFSFKGNLTYCLISIYSLNYALPIFNYKKVDGMALSIRIIRENSLEEEGNKIYTITDQLHFAGNNYPENLVITDGKYIPPKLINSEYIDKITKRLQCYSSNELKKDMKIPKLEEAPNIKYKTNSGWSWYSPTSTVSTWTYDTY